MLQSFWGQGVSIRAQVIAYTMLFRSICCVRDLVMKNLIITLEKIWCKSYPYYSLYSTSPLHGCFDYFWLKMIKQAAAAAPGCHCVCLLVFGVFGEWYQIQLVISRIGFLIVDPQASTFHIKAARCL